MGHTHTHRKNNSLTRKFTKNYPIVVTSLVKHTLPPPPSPITFHSSHPPPPPPFPIIKHCTIDKYWIENHDSQSMQFSVHTFGVPYYLFNKYSVKMASNPIRDHAATHGKNSNNRVGEAIYIYIYIYNIYLLQSRCNNNVRYFQSH